MAIGVSVLVYVLWRPGWMGVEAGDLGAQLAFGLIGAPVAFVAAVLGQRWLSRRRGALSAPCDAAAMSGIAIASKSPRESSRLAFHQAAKVFARW